MKTKSAIRVLSDEEICKIHEFSIRILEEIGVKITHKEAIRILENGGCIIDKENKRVKIPESLTNEIIKKNTGQKPKFFYRDSPRCVEFDGELFFSLNPIQLENMLTGSENCYVFDFNNFERREAREEDVKNAIILADALDNIKIVGIPIIPYEFPPNTRTLHALAIALQYTSKPISWVHVSDLRTAKLAIEIESIIVGGKEELRKKTTHIAIIEGISPLRYSDANIDLLLFYAREGIPGFSISSMPSLGLTGPLSIPAAIAQNIAEIIPAIYLVNLVNPEMKIPPGWCNSVNYGYSWAMDVIPLNPYNFRHMYAAPETFLIGLAETQFIRECYGVPVWGTRALRTDAKIPGIQSAIDKTLSATVATLAGALGLGPAGQLDSDQIFCFEQLIIDNEIVNLLKRIKEGIMSELEDFDIERIKKGVEKGNFITDVLTLKRIRSTIYTSDLIDRMRYDEWVKKGKKDMLIHAHEKVVKIIKNHQPTSQIDRETLETINKILKDADRILNR
jgi:trimethylamine--corrinoid protein Co-methyltransferase